MCLAILEALAKHDKARKQAQSRPDLVNPTSGLYHIPSTLALSDCGTRRQASSRLILSGARCYTSDWPHEQSFARGGIKSEEG